MPNNCDCNTPLPYHVLRWIRAYRPRMRGVIAGLLQDRQAANQTITAQDIAECIGMAVEMLEAEIQARVELPAPDQKTVEEARQAARENRVSTIDEILHALP